MTSKVKLEKQQKYSHGSCFVWNAHTHEFGLLCAQNKTK